MDRNELDLSTGLELARQQVTIPATSKATGGRGRTSTATVSPDADSEVTGLPVGNTMPIARRLAHRHDSAATVYGSDNELTNASATRQQFFTMTR
jgi:hypothetical protein